MAEEKQTPEIDDTLSHDDTSMLRYVLMHTRGASAVSMYDPEPVFDDEEVAE